MATAANVAKYILTLSDEDEGDLISNLKLQKLLYYSQGFSLAILDRPLFEERIKAWEHGPVVPEVWHAYREYEKGPIPCPDDFDLILPRFRGHLHKVDNNEIGGLRCRKESHVANTATSTNRKRFG